MVRAHVWVENKNQKRSAQIFDFLEDFTRRVGERGEQENCRELFVFLRLVER